MGDDVKKVFEEARENMTGTATPPSKNTYLISAIAHNLLTRIKINIFTR